MSLSDLRMAVVSLKIYEIPIQTSVAQTSLIFCAFASHCPVAALQVYAIAASHAPDLHALAVYASQFLLSLNWSTMTDEMAIEIGATYLRRLYLLHRTRIQDFKQLTVGLPQPHEGLPHCNGSGLREAWVFATAYLSWSASPNTSISDIDKAMACVMDKAACNSCKELLRNRFRVFKHEWSLVKNTI